MGGSLVRNGFDFSFSHDIYDEHVTAYGVDSYRYHGKELEPVRLGLLSVPVLEKNPLEDFTFKKSIAS